MWYSSRRVAFERSLCFFTLLVEKMADPFSYLIREWFKHESKLGDRMIKQLFNSLYIMISLPIEQLSFATSFRLLQMAEESKPSY